jgi:hypothetical protein
MNTTKNQNVIDDNELSFTAENNRAPMLGEGDFVVDIETANKVFAKAGKVFEDETPQIECKLRHAPSKKTITMWLNLLGYLRFNELTVDNLKGIAPAQLGTTKQAWDKLSTDRKIAAAFSEEVHNGESYAVSNITKRRIVDNARTQKAHGIINSVLLNSGVKQGTAVNGLQEVIDTLNGATIGVHIEKSGTKNMAKVMYTLDPAQVEEEVEA